MFQVSGPDVSKLNKQQECIRSIPGVQTKISCSQNVRDKFEKNQQNYTSRLATFVSVTKSDGTSKTNAQVRVMGHQLLHCLSKKNRNFHCSLNWIFGKKINRWTIAKTFESAFCNWNSWGSGERIWNLCAYVPWTVARAANAINMQTKTRFANPLTPDWDNVTVISQQKRPSYLLRNGRPTHQFQHAGSSKSSPQFQAPRPLCPLHIPENHWSNEHESDDVVEQSLVHKRWKRFSTGNLCTVPVPRVRKSIIVIGGFRLEALISVLMFSIFWLKSPRIFKSRMCTTSTKTNCG